LSGLRYLSASDIAALGFSDAELLAAVERGFLAHGKGEASIEPRLPLSRIADGFVVQRASLLSHAKVGVRVLGNFPANDALGLSIEPSLLALFSATDGYPLVLVETSRQRRARRPPPGTAQSARARPSRRRQHRLLEHPHARRVVPFR
jgi:alanine dehydrogenase